MSEFFEMLSATIADEALRLQKEREVAEATKKAAKVEEDAKRKIDSRNWATRLLEEGIETDHHKITSAMLIIVTDPEVRHKEAERLVLLQEKYRPLIFQRLVEKFLERGGDPAGSLGIFCIQRALRLPEDADLFAGDVCPILVMGLVFLRRFSVAKRSEIFAAMSLLRKKFPLKTRDGKWRMPRKIAEVLHPDFFNKNQKEGAPSPRPPQKENPAPQVFQKEKGGSNEPTPKPQGKNQRYSLDNDVLEGLEMAASGKIDGVTFSRVN